MTRRSGCWPRRSPRAAAPQAGGVVLVAASTRSIDGTIAEARRLLVLSALAAALVAGLVAAGLARRALRPLSRLSAGAREITRTSDPTRRLPEPATGDELSELAGTLNTMLGALAQARERERRFVADASHELRTPLTALRGNAEHIARHGADPEALADLAAGAERLSRLIDDLLVLAREDAAAPPTRTRVALAEVARRVARREPLVDLEIRADAPTSGDEDALERAVANLVENARLYGPAGGRIRVTVDARDGLSELPCRTRGLASRPRMPSAPSSASGAEASPARDRARAWARDRPLDGRSARGHARHRGLQFQPAAALRLTRRRRFP